MQIREVTHAEAPVQIGGGAGWVAAQLRNGLVDARTALRFTAARWDKLPIAGPHPREAAIIAAREAVAHLNEALTVEAPRDALDETRQALAALDVAITTLQQLPNRPILDPTIRPATTFEHAIELLERAEQRLTGANWGWG